MRNIIYRVRWLLEFYPALKFLLFIGVLYLVTFCQVLFHPMHADILVAFIEPFWGIDEEHFTADYDASHKYIFLAYSLTLQSIAIPLGTIGRGRVALVFFHAGFLVHALPAVVLNLHLVLWSFAFTIVGLIEGDPRFFNSLVALIAFLGWTAFYLYLFYASFQGFLKRRLWIG